jgi:Tfp pilus assembly protein PilN
LQAGFDLSEARQQALPREVGFAKQLADQRAFSWTRMLSDLEEAVPPSVSLGSVALTPRESIVTLNGSALTLKDVTAFVNALENHRAFRDVVLSQHRVKESTKEEGHHYRQRPAVEFTLTVTYRPHPDLLPHSGGEGRSEREGKGGTRS